MGICNVGRCTIDGWVGIGICGMNCGGVDGAKFEFISLPESMAVGG